MIVPSMVGKDGKVRVWDIPARKWKRCSPVDAREQIAAGTASVECALIEMQGPSGRQYVEKKDVEMYKRRGYHVLTAPASEESLQPATATPEKPLEEFNATPSALALAKDEGVNLADVKGTGNEGRITKEDVLNFLDSREEDDDEDDTED